MLYAKYISPIFLHTKKIDCYFVVINITNTKQVKMINQKLSIYIPHVFANITKERIVDIFNRQSICDIERIDFVPKKGKDGKEYNIAFIHMKCWFDNDSVSNLQTRILNKNVEARIVYDDPWFWNLYENVNPRSASELKMEEQIQALTKSVNTQNDKFEKMDAFTQYLEDELHQAQATIALLQDQLALRTPVSSPSKSSSPPAIVREHISADIANELSNFKPIVLNFDNNLEKED